MGFAQTLSTLNSIVSISDKSSTDVDSLLSALGFQNTAIEGLKFTYNKKSEFFILQTMPRQITYTFTDKATYLKINSEVSSQGYQLVNAQEEIVYNQKSKTVSTFEKSTIKISFGTDLNTSTKVTTYCIWLTNSNPKYLNTAVKTEEVKQTEVTKETSPEVKSPKVQPILFGTLNSKPKKIDPIDTAANSSGDNIVPVPRRITLGVGLFKVASLTDYYTSMGSSYHFGIEMTKKHLMTKRKLFYTNTRFLLGGSAYMGMKAGTGDAEITIRKYFLSAGITSEWRYKKCSFVIKCAPAANLTTGKRYGDDAKASFFAVALNAGEYIQWYTGSSSTKQDKMYVRLGFDWFIPLKGDFTGSIGLTLGF